MEKIPARPVGPFIAAGMTIAFVAVVVAGLPDPLVSRIEQNRPLTDAQAGWATRFIAVAAALQALYAGWAVLRPERVEAEIERSPKFAAMAPERLVATVARNAAVTTLLTLVYGLALLAITGERGTFWIFPALAVAQGAWYFRITGEVAEWLRRRAAVPPAAPPVAWRGAPPGYVPPLVRGADAERE